MTYGLEALPPLLILPTSADNPRIPEELILLLPQVKGKFGHKRVKHFDFMIATSEKGGMTSQIFEKYLRYLIRCLYPDVSDQPG